jgi:hypothetical protein
MIKNKLILREITKRWCKGILMANDLTDEATYELLTEDEADYIQKEAFKIADRITKLPQAHSLNSVIAEYRALANGQKKETT